jgi:hypothetical protein
MANLSLCTCLLAGSRETTAKTFLDTSDAAMARLPPHLRNLVPATFTDNSTSGYIHRVRQLLISLAPAGIAQTGIAAALDEAQKLEAAGRFRDALHQLKYLKPVDKVREWALGYAVCYNTPVVCAILVLC